MRFVPVSGLMEGMVVGKSLYDRNRQLLLGRGSIVQKSYIERIEKLGYQGIYIDDEISKDIEVKDIISDELRMKTVQVVKDIFIYSSMNNTNTSKQIAEKMQQTKQLVSNIVEQILENNDTMVNLIDLKFFDDYTFFHSVNVTVLSVLVGTELGLDRSELYNLGLAALLHDIGKIFIDKEILNKKGKLSEDEYIQVKDHAKFGYNYLKETYDIPISSYVGVLQHHEKFDGTGYPNNKAKDEISLYGRIICVTDVYDALISNRPYRAALLPSEAMEYIMANGGIMFDLELTKIFARKVAPFPVGTYVKLSNGYIGIVVENYEEVCMRPKVKIILDNEGKKIMPRYLNLKDDKKLRSITITATNKI